MKHEHVILQFDGAAKPNPGRTASAAILYTPDGETIFHACEGEEHATNNVAEWNGLRLGLECALRLGAERVDAYGDSQLVIMQAFNGLGVSAPHLEPIAARVRELVAKFKSVTGRHITREQNAAADALGDRFLDGTYLPYKYNATAQDERRSVAVTLALRLPAGTITSIADRNAIKKLVTASTKTALPVATIGIKRTGTDPYESSTGTEITFVAEIVATANALIDMRPICERIKSALRNSFPGASKISIALISG